MNWDRFDRLAREWLLTPRVVHPWPSVRFAATVQGKSRGNSASTDLYGGCLVKGIPTVPKRRGRSVGVVVLSAGAIVASPLLE